MKNFIVLAFCCFALMGCSPVIAEEAVQTVTQDTQKTLDDTGKYINERKEDYEIRIRKDLNRLKAKINLQEQKLSSDAARMGKDVDKDLQKQIHGLHRQEKALDAQLPKVEKSGEKDLDQLKSDIDKGMKNLKKGYDDLLESMKAK